MKLFFSILFSITLTLALCQDEETAAQDSSASVLEIVPSKNDSIIAMATSYIGVKYQYAGLSNKGLDCSGLVWLSYRSVQIDLPRSSKELAKIGQAIEADNLRKGDLIFFKGRNTNSVGHVAIVSKIKDGLVYIIHATSSRGVMEEVLQTNAYFLKRWLFNKRVN